ncbi:MAG: hypothetical protein JST22_16120 [Bacteroidetes bacterium]|nr:hypothetical protein [Bacteroidota bacterium]
MRRINAAVYLLLLTIAVAAHAAPMQTLKIYHIGVGQGDCTFIIAKKEQSRKAPIVVSALIDVGSGPIVRAGRDPALLWAALLQIMGENSVPTINYLILSHLDEDHMGAAEGLLYVLERPNFKKYAKGMIVVDRGWLDPSTKPTGTIYTGFEGRFGTGKPWRRKKIDVKENLFDGYFDNMKMWCVAANGVSLQPRNGDPTKWNRRVLVPSGSLNENDRCYGFLIEFDGFRYFTAGDMTGYDVDSQHNIELGFSDFLTQCMQRAQPSDGNCHVCCLKVNHHGSINSTNPDFVTATKPRLAVFSSGLQMFSNGRLPQQAVATRLRTNNAACSFFYTYCPTNIADPYDGTVQDNDPLFFTDQLDRWQDIVVSVSRPSANLVANRLYGDDITMKVQACYRDRSTFARTSNLRDLPDVVCSKKHPAP